VDVEQVEIQHLVVGVGVIGLAVAAEHSRRRQEVVVLETGSRIGGGISSRSNKVIRSRIYYRSDSLKRRSCVEGRRLLYDYYAERGVSNWKCGKLAIATDDRD
jgi:L-2-hydroxyglutarate oxidase LhgO